MPGSYWDYDEGFQVPIVQFKLLHFMSIPLPQSVCTIAKAVVDMDGGGMWILEPKPKLGYKVREVSHTLFVLRMNGLSVVRKNPSGFTHKLEKGQDVGQVYPVEKIEPVEETPSEGGARDDQVPLSGGFALQKGRPS